MLSHISFSVSITVISWVVGMAVGSVLRKTRFYDVVSNLNFVTSKKLNTQLGVGVIKWVVKNTWLKYFNPALKLSNKPSVEELNRLRDEMTFAEINHLIGFSFVVVFAMHMLFQGKLLPTVIMMTINVIMNFYPSLLQQENKRRIDRFIKRCVKP